MCENYPKHKVACTSNKKTLKQTQFRNLFAQIHFLQSVIIIYYMWYKMIIDIIYFTNNNRKNIPMKNGRETNWSR